MPNYKLSNQKLNTGFEVANVFVDHYMKSAQPVYVLIYLYGLRMCSAAKAVTSQEIASELGILESDVVKAWEYWNSAGVITISNRKSETDFTIEFLDLSMQATAPKTEAPKQEKKMPHTYSPLELELYMKQEKKIKELFDFTQDKLGKMLTPNDLSLLYSFYDFYHLPFEVIFMMIEHYATQGKKSLRYFEKVALSWNEKGINTVEKVEEYLCNLADKKAAAQEPVKKQSPAARNKFINFEQRDIDYNALAKRMLEQRVQDEREVE